MDKEGCGHNGRGGDMFRSRLQLGNRQKGRQSKNNEKEKQYNIPSSVEGKGGVARLLKQTFRRVDGNIESASPDNDRSEVTNYILSRMNGV